MISLTYWVTCDGPHPEDPDERCEAEFEVSATDVFSDIAGLHRQMKGRGWRFDSRDDRKFFCPLHPAAPAPEVVDA